MSNKREYVRQRESQHPHAIEFSAFVHKLYANGTPVTRAIAIKWIISSYKREALIRFGAKHRATCAIRADLNAGFASRKREQLTKSALSFSVAGTTITEKQAEAFLDTGISIVMRRLVAGRSGTYVYDKDSRLFMPVGASAGVSTRKNVGLMRQIVAALSGGQLTAADIAEKCRLDVRAVRNNLNYMRRAGAVEKAGMLDVPRGRPLIVWRLKEAVCNAVT